MIEFLRRKFIKNYRNINNEKVRTAHGKMAAIIGIISNLILFITKLLIGIFTFSISIVADSINNLSDMASSIATLIGFHLAQKPADKEHPYGHERIEYVTGLIISLIVVIVGSVLLITSIYKLVNYKTEEIDYLLIYISIGILCFAIILKVLQFFAYKRIGNIINSLALKAAAQDSLNDCISTGAVLVGTIIILILSLNNIVLSFSIDGILGIFVSIFIIISGIKLLKDEVNPLIGVPVSNKFVNGINKFIKSHDIVLGTHDIICHMYGPTKCYMTVHVEVDSRLSLIDVHDKIDEIEMEVKEKYNVILTTHMDPIIFGDKELDKIKITLDDVLASINKKIQYHDLRLINSSDKVIFDLDLNYDLNIDEEELIKKIENDLEAKLNKKYKLIINIDYPFVD